MLIDMHVHSSGISRCCKIPYDEAIRAAKEAGIDGIYLTNHYARDYAKDIGYAAFAEKYVEEYAAAKAYGDSIGYPVWFGIELTWRACNNAHLPIYGVGPEFVLEHPDLFDYSPEKLYEAVHAAGGVTVHAHPLRRGSRLLDLRYLDGIEANCHPGYEGPLYGELAPVAREAGKFMTCGSDYHGDVPFRPHCGIYFPDGADTPAKMLDYLRNTDEIRICLNECAGAEREESFVKE